MATDCMTDSLRNRFPPLEDAPILPWYDGAFSHCFVAFHPFFAVEGLNPSSCDYGTLVLKASERPKDTNLLDWMDEAAISRKASKEIFGSSVDEIAKRFGQAIKWQSIVEELGFADGRQLDRALRTHIAGLRPEFADETAANSLVSYCQRREIFLPTEGQFQPIMEAGLATAFRNAGFSQVIVGDEFGDEERPISVDSLAEPHTWASRDDFPQWGARRFIASDSSMLVWTHWDSFYTAFLGVENRIVASRVAEIFEGFWCSRANTIYWLDDNHIGF